MLDEGSEGTPLVVEVATNDRIEILNDLRTKWDKRTCDSNNVIEGWTHSTNGWCWEFRKMLEDFSSIILESKWCMIRFLNFQQTSHYQDGKWKPNCRFFKGHQNIAKEFVAIGKHVVDRKIMQIVLNALLVSYESFIQSIMVQNV